MEAQIETNLEITPADIDFVKAHIKDKYAPVGFADIVYQVALFKTQAKRHTQVKLYDPHCAYSPGDLIYKEYPGKLPAGGKNFIDLREGVILKVEEVRSRLGMEEIRLSYDGTSDFRKYTEYLKRQKIDLLLPHKQEDPPRPPEYLRAEEDPRDLQAPLIERDFSILRKKLASMLNRENDITFISDKLLLKQNLKEIKPEAVEQIKEFLRGQQASASTEFLVQNFLRVEPGATEFEAYCFALNHVLGQNYKIDLQQTRSAGWGKWHLNSVLYQLKKNARISEPNPLLATISLKNKKNLQQRRKKIEDAVFSEGDTRYYLTQREILSGALRLKPGLYDFADATEIEAADTVSKKIHVLFYYRNEDLLLGFETIYNNYKVLQGTTLIFEQDEQRQFHFTIKTTKKGTITDRVIYDPEQKLFRVSEEKVAAPVFVNKAMFLEADVFRTLENRIGEFRKLETYNKLIHKVFLEFGIKEKNYEIHILRLCHILDLIYPVDLKTVGEIILSSPEFIPSEKIAGVFYLDSDAVVEIEEEERQRRQKIVEEMKKKREEQRRQQLDEELRKKEEIRHLREEHKRKREDEMRLAEKLRQERELQKQREEQAPARFWPAAAGPRFRSREAPPPEIPAEAAKAETPRKSKRKEGQEKPSKAPKKGQKKILEEKIEMDESKKEILQEELKGEAADKPSAKKKIAPEAKVVYQDSGGFGGIFASKLEEIVKKEEKDEPPRDKKK